MASRKTEVKTVEEVPEVTPVMTGNPLEKAEDRDAEIERLKKELAEAKARASYATPRDEKKRIKELENEAAENGTDPWSIKVSVRVPRRGRTEDPWYWININGLSAQIPADDKVQEMKLPFAVVLMDMLAAEEMAQDYADSLEVKDPVNNPH